MKHTPTVGEHLYTYTPCSDYWVASVRRPYTVIHASTNECIIQEARPVFYGDVYYDTLPDEIVLDPYGKTKKLRWSEKKQRWQESPASSYPEVAVFGKWDYAPYLN